MADNIDYAGPLRSRLAENAPDTAQSQIRLKQMLYDRSLAAKRGEDTEGAGYAEQNAKIRNLRNYLKLNQGG